MEVNIFTKFAVITCSRTDCAVSFAVTAEHQRELIDTHADFFCPRGHRQAYVHKSEAEKLRDQLARTTAQLDQERACCREKSERLNELGTRLQKTRAGYRGQIARQRKASK